ncbi:MAG: hypothetical protein P8N02_05240 [Actinomycetota bacterium]|jgi:hypothetical protein|nr:hypothetical protein [Actinomycetota bacterium]
MAVLSAIGFWLVVGTPFLITLLAFLDVARRPSWAWAMTGRRQAVWMGVLGGAALTWLGGAAVAVWYFATAYRDVRDAERGDLRFWSEGTDGPTPPTDDQPPCS